MTDLEKLYAALGIDPANIPSKKTHDLEADTMDLAMTMYKVFNVFQKVGFKRPEALTITISLFTAIGRAPNGES